MNFSETRTRSLWFVILSAILLPSLIFNFSVLKLTGLISDIRFGDLKLVLEWTECYKESGDLLYQTFDPNVPCSGYIYGEPIMQVLNMLGINESGTTLFGYIFCLMIALIFAMSLNFNKSSKSTLLLVILSPPFALLLDRGNLDTFVAFLVLMSALAFSRRLELLATIILVIATLLKFYTFPILLIAFVLSKANSKKIIIATSIVFTGLLIAMNIQKIQTPFPSGYFAKFGALIWGSYAEKYSMFWSSKILQSVINASVAGLSIFLVHKARKYKQELVWNLNTNSRNQVIIIWFLMAHFACFILGLSYDYRLVFIAIAALAYLADREDQIYKIERKILTILLVTSLWFTFLIPKLAPIGDIALEVLTLWIFFQVFIAIMRNIRRKHVQSF